MINVFLINKWLQRCGSEMLPRLESYNNIDLSQKSRQKQFSTDQQYKYANYYLSVYVLFCCLVLAYFHAASASGEKLAMLRSQREI